MTDKPMRGPCGWSAGCGLYFSSYEIKLVVGKRSLKIYKKKCHQIYAHSPDIPQLYSPGAMQGVSMSAAKIYQNISSVTRH